MEYIKLFQNHSDYENFVSGGTMVKPNVSHCVNENEVHYNPIDWSKEYLTIESLEDNNTIYLKATSTSVTKTISASTDNGASWTEYTSSTGESGTTIATLNNGDKLLLNGENSTYAKGNASYNQFNSTGQFKVKGNIMSLVNGDSFANADELTETSTFCYLFYQCTGLTSAENLMLPATTLVNNCYYGMFEGCTSLIATPEFPATTLVFSCYYGMFKGCTSLTTAPVLSATTLAQYCYSNMFNGCTSLVNAPELPATTLVMQCYSGMFRNCTNLVNAPELPATTLAEMCYKNMFKGCTSLTTAPELLAVTLEFECYSEMFNGCTSLNYIKAMFTTEPSTTYTEKWVNGVAASGTFVKNSAATWSNVRGANYIPYDWTVETATE